MTDNAARRQAYQKSSAKHGASPKALQWKDYPAAASRFAQLTADLNVGGKSILDVGCGMGDVIPYLYARGSDFTYHGVDITPEFIDIACQRYTGHHFDVFDPFSSMPDERYDIVICSGVLNAKQPDWMARRQRMIEQLFELSTEAMAFNMAGWHGPAEERGTIAYADITEIEAFCRSLTPKIIVRNHYHERDFTVLMLR